MEYLYLKTFYFLTPLVQIVLIATLFVIITFRQYLEFKKSGKMYTHYPLRVSILFVPIYEEIIFRGLILYGLMNSFAPIAAVVISTALFGIWHLKNIFWLTKKLLIEQVLYAGLIFGPVAAFLTISSGTVWPAVILHYLNNILSPHISKILKIKS